MSLRPVEPSSWNNVVGTSAMGALGRRQTGVVVLVAGALTMAGTTSSAGTRSLTCAVGMNTYATNSGAGAMSEETTEVALEARSATRSALAELRRASGLTWDQMSRLFGVSRRSVHFWASGKPMTSEHEEHLYRVLALVHGASASADALRAALLSVVAGEQVLTMLVERRYADAEAALAMGEARITASRVPLSASAAAARRPLDPEFLAGSADDQAHPIHGRGRSASTVRSKVRGQS